MLKGHWGVKSLMDFRTIKKKSGKIRGEKMVMMRCKKEGFMLM